MPDRVVIDKSGANLAGLQSVNVILKFTRVSDLLCMSNSVHASKPKEHDNNDDFQRITGRAAERH